VRTDKAGKRSRPTSSGRGARRARAKFLAYYPGGFRDPSYLELERGYKWRAHEQWQRQLGQEEFAALLAAGAFGEIAARAVRIESRTNLLFSFEKMALRDAVKSAASQPLFAQALHALLHGPGALASRFDRWIEAIAALPRRQTRVLTWPLATVFAFIAQPRDHIFFKPQVTRKAAAAYGFAFDYQSRPSWPTYQRLLEFADTVRKDVRDLKPRDMIDIQSFIWVQGSDEYED
jgi:hypothetical protein